VHLIGEIFERKDHELRRRLAYVIYIIVYFAQGAAFEISGMFGLNKQ